jgi:hypothetical protein
MTISGTGDIPDYELAENAPPWYNALISGSIKIRTAEIKDGITRIGNNTFAQCTILTSVTIPNSVTSIGM